MARTFSSPFGHLALATALAMSLFATVQPARAQVLPERVRIIVPPDKGVGQSSPLHLEAFVYKPTSPGKHPVLIFNHGSAGGEPRQSQPSEAIANLFVSKGFVVIVPMRRGRGSSDGQSLEGEDKNCDLSSWALGLRAAFDDVTAVFDYAETLKYADAARVVIAGASRGGYLSVAYAAEGSRRSRIAGVINLVGGWVAQSEDSCPTDFNTVSYSRFGKETRLPELWLYGDKDPYNLTASIISYRDAYRGSGGLLQFRLVRDVPLGGHALPLKPDLWDGDLDRYLYDRKLP